MHRVLPIALAALLLAACGDRSAIDIPRNHANTMAVHAYAVPIERADELQGALNSIFYAGEDQPVRGRAWRAGESRLLVLAPVAMHASLGEAIADVLEGGGERAPTRAPSAIRMTYWFVDVAPTADADDPRLAALGDVLAEARSQLGDARFVLADTVTITMLPDGGKARASGRSAVVETRLEARGDGAIAALDIAAGRGAELETRVPLRHGQYAVLAQIDTRQLPGEPSRTRLVVMRSDPATSR